VAKKPTATESDGPATAPRRALLAILVVAAVLRFVPLGVSQPRFHHLDEWDFAMSAEQMVATGDLNPHRFHHPGLYRYAIALAYPVTNLVLRPLLAPEAQQWVPYITGRLLSAAAGVLGVLLAWKLAMRLMGLAGAAAAAGVLALMPLPVQFGHIAKPDTTMAMWVGLTLLLAWRIAEKPSRRLYVLAGLCIGFATGSKYNGLMACVAVLAAHMVAPGNRPWYRRLVGGDLWLAALCSVVGFVVTSPFHVLDYGSMLAEFRTGYAFVVAGDRAESAQRAPALVEFGAKAAEWIGAVPLLLAAAGAAVWWRRDRRALLVVGAPLVAYVLLISGWAFRQAHYLMPIVPAVAVMAAAPVAALWPRRRRLAAALVAAMLLPGAVVSVREVVRFWRPDTKTLAFRALRERLRGPHGWILRDYDALWDTAGDVLPIKNPGFEFYDVVGREYLKERGISHFVLSDGVADFDAMPPEQATRRGARRAELLACGDLLARVEPGWWRAGPGIEVYAVKPSVRRAFAEERERAARDLVAKVATIENELARRPDDVTLHMEAARLLGQLAWVRTGQGVLDAYRRAIHHAERATAMDPGSADATYNLGTLHVRLGAWLTTQRAPNRVVLDRLERARTALRKAIELDPDQADYYFNLGYVLMGAGAADPAEPDRLFHKARSLDPAIGGVERGPRPLH